MTPKSRTDVFIYIAAVTGLVFALGMAAILQEKPGSWIITGAVFGVLMAIFGTPRLVGETRTLQFSGDKETFVGQLNVGLAQLGYQPTARTGDFLSYKATGESSFGIGPITLAPASFLAIGVQLSGDTATVIGPHKAVTDLTQRLAG